MANINWLPLSELNQIEQLRERSKNVPCLIFKHSTRCSLSSLAQNRLESHWAFGEGDLIPYHLDLVANRPLSDAVVEAFGVRHESPQVLLIRNGVCTYHASHLDVSVKSLKAALSQEM